MKSENIYSERLNKAVAYLKWQQIIKTQKQLANKIGVETSNLSFALKGGRESKTVAEKFADKFTNIFSKEWIMFGEGEMLKTLQNPPAAIPSRSSIEGIPLIPIGAAAGVLSGDDVQVLEYECERFVVPTFKDAEFLMPVKGSSMIPKYNSGDIVACKRITDLLFFQWNKIYVLDTSQGVLIKRVHEDKTNPDNIVLVSDNEKYQPFAIPKDDIRSIAIVIGVIRLE